MNRRTRTVARVTTRVPPSSRNAKLPPRSCVTRTTRFFARQKYAHQEQPRTFFTTRGLSALLQRGNRFSRARRQHTRVTPDVCHLPAVRQKSARRRIVFGKTARATVSHCPVPVTGDDTDSSIRYRCRDGLSTPISFCNRTTRRDIENKIFQEKHAVSGVCCSTFVGFNICRLSADDVWRTCSGCNVDRCTLLMIHYNVI